MILSAPLGAEFHPPRKKQVQTVAWILMLRPRPQYAF